jgi:organic hydroperoxide reductase OsmC/OhrA
LNASANGFTFITKKKMPFKTDKHKYNFEVQLNWIQGKTGILTANDVKDVIRVATPPEFKGGIPDMWSPEHLLLSSLCSCLMSTCLALADKKQFSISHFECSAIGQVQLDEGHLAFSVINVYPRLSVENEEGLAKGKEILLQAYKHSIVANSLRAQLIHHGEVIVDRHPVHHEAF